MATIQSRNSDMISLPKITAENFKGYLLGENAKLAKMNGREYLIRGLAIAPHMRSGFNVCPEAGFCSAVCNLWFSGRTVTAPVRNAMINRARFFVDDQRGFYDQLTIELGQHARRAKRKRIKPLCRLNVASDLDFESVAIQNDHIQFYDYTKVWSRCVRVLRGFFPDNYELTYSYSERAKTRNLVSWLAAGHNVSVVFDTDYYPQSGRIGDLPTEWRIGRKTWQVIDGDKHDMRLRKFDGSGVIVGLRFKGSRKLLDESVRRGFTVSALMRPIRRGVVAK